MICVSMVVMLTHLCLDGSDGGDFDHEIALDTIDFGVFHSYPDWWTKVRRPTLNLS
jgi:hypothetical protein